MFKTKTRLGTKAMSVFMSLLMAASMLTVLMSVQPTEEVSAAGDYGLADNIQDGTILHCFDWTYNDIKAMIPDIAKAGFTSVQTSPAQQACGTGPWYWAYQPLGFYIGNTFGTKEELRALCDEAHRYGVKVIVDAIGNHLAGDHSNIQDDLKDSQYWHNTEYTSDDPVPPGKKAIDWTNRWQVTHGDVGMPDLNTEHSYVQQCAKNYLLELKSVGVDGIRWDTTKHISLPSEGDNFWPTVTEAGLYQYGEILVGPDDRESGNEGLMKEYTNYMSVTDSKYGDTVTGAFNNGQVPTANGNWSNRGITPNKLVYWAESHDTYANDNGWTKYLDQNIIDRSYAIAASRADATALYFSRPPATNKMDIKIGQKGSTHFTSKEVAEVNKFHNAMVGQKEYYTTGDNCAVVCREKGAVIAMGSGSNRDVNVPNGGGLVAPGKYTDQVSGSEFTVTSTTISGHVGNTGIAVIYNPDAIPVGGSVSATPADGTTFTDTLTVTLKASNVTDAKYTTSEGASGSYTDGQTITVGSSTSVGGKVTVTLSGKKSDGSSATATYTYTKKDPSAVTAVYFDNSGYNWSSVYAYIYKGEGSAAVKVAEWPGTAMTKDSATGYYKIEIPEGFENGRVMFTENANATTNRYPADQQPGLEIGGNSMLFSAGNKWEKYQDPTPPPSDPTVTSDKASGTDFTTETMDITLGLKNATSGTYSVDNGPTKTFTSSTKVTIGEGKIGDSVVTVKTTAKGSDGTTKSYTFTYNKKYVKKTSNAKASVASLAAVPTALSASSGTLSSYYKTNPNGTSKSKTITVDGSVSDWDSSMLIAQGTANDDPRVYRPNSMYEIPYDAYALYGTWDDTNLYLMIEMTNVQDVVAPNDNFPLGSNATVDNIPMFIYIDTGKSDAIGNSGKTQTGGTLWSCNTTVTNSFNRVIAMASGVGKNGPYIYGGDSTGINEVELGNATTSGIVYKTGKGILSSNVYGINGAYGENNNRVLGDMCSDSADWVDFNTKGHNSSTMDYNYEVSIPLSQLGITKSDIESNGIGVLFVHSSGASGMDCLPYDLTMNDNADQPDPASQEFNSFEKSDSDNITTSFARLGKGGGVTPPPDPDLPLQVNFGADRSAPQEAGTALTLKGIGYGGSETGYKYEFIVDGKTVQASSTKDTYAWNLTSGSHTIKCIITDSTGATATSTKTYTADGDTPVNPLINNSTISATSITKGSSITMTAKATGGTKPYTYTYYCQSPTSSSYTVLETTTNTTKSHTPANSGTYKYAVKVTDATGEEQVNYFTVTVKATTTALTNNSTISATSITLGTTIKMTAKAAGGTAPYKYKYYCRPSTSSEYTALTGSVTETTHTHTPARAITYYYAVKIADSKGATKTKYFTVTVKAPATPLTNVSTISATSITQGTSIKMTAKATGGTTPYKYTYFCKPTGAVEWVTITSATHTPAKVGTYQYAVKVTDATGEEQVKYFTVTVKAPATPLANNSTISATSITLGTTIKMTAKATGGTAPYKYKYYCRPSTSSEYTALTDSVTETTHTHTPARAITYYYAVKIADSKGATKTKYFTVNVSNAALANVSTISATSITLGTTIKMTAKATGGTAPYKYKYYCRPSTSSEYTALTGSVTETTHTHTPARAITYYYAVKIADSKGATKTKYFTVNVSNAALANASTISATSIKLGTTIKMTAKATGGTAPYKYKYYCRPSTSSEYTALTGSVTETTHTHTPARAITYYYAVKIADSKGATKTKYFTVKVS